MTLRTAREPVFRRRPKDEPAGDDAPADPRDDAEDFHLSDAQRRIRTTAHTRAQMRKVWDQVQANLRCPWGNGKPMRWTT